MANVTFSVEDDILSGAKKTAEAAGTTIHKMIREYLESLNRPQSKDDLAEEFIRLSLATGGKSNGWKFNREELYDRR